MQIGLIAMSGVRVRNDELRELGVTLPGFVRRGEVISRLPSLGLMTVAGLTPDRHNVTYLEYDGVQEEGLPDFDLVGISSFTAMIEEAYDLCGRFRDQGTPVVLGGLHVSSRPEEARQHSDAVVVDGAEGAWPEVLRDAQEGSLQPLYQGARSGMFDPARYVMPEFEILQERPYNRVTIQTSRGCPRDCDFCAASLRITDRFAQKPITRVIREIREAKKHVDHPFFELADDNSFLNKTWSKRFLRELIPEEIRFFTETDASVAEDPELCDLLAKAGCRQLLIGFESPRAKDLEGIDPANWKKRQVPRMMNVINTLQSRGISVNGCFILGLDHHTPDVFPMVREFVEKSGLADVQYTVLTPFPGTPLYRRMREEGRLIDERPWSRCTLFDVTYEPARMSVEELQKGMEYLFRETYERDDHLRRRRAFVDQKRGVDASS